MQLQPDQGPTADDIVSFGNRSVKRAAGWSFVMNVTRMLSTLGTALILAGLLGPRLFGIVAVALIYVGLLQLVIQQGLMSALIQRAGLTHQQLNTAFWILVPLSVGLMLISLIGADAWAQLNGVPDAAPVIRVLSILIVVKSLAVVPEAVLRRTLQFRPLAVRTTVASTLGACVGLLWAAIQPSVWALVAQQLVIESVGCIVIWTASRWRPHRRLTREGMLPLGNFALKTTLSGLAVFANNRLDALLIGLYFGPTAVGLYRLGGRIVESAVDFTGQPIQQVALPGLAGLGDDRAAMSARYRKMVVMLVITSAPVMAAIAATAEPLMQLLGDEWTPAAASLQLLCVVGVVRAMIMLNGPLLQASGNPGLQATISWIGAVLSAVTLVVVGLALQGESVSAQVVGMAASRALLFALVFLPLGQLAVGSRLPDAEMATYLRLVTPPLAACLLAAVLGALAADAMTDAGTAPVFVVLVVGLGVAALAVTLSALWPLETRQLVRQLLAAAGRVRRRTA